MLTLRQKKANDGYVASAQGLPMDQRVAFVLPRFLRKPFRVFIRLFQGRVKLPRYIGWVGALGFYASVAVYGVIIGGYSHDIIKSTASASGFAIENIRVTGNTETSEIDILGPLGLDGFTSLVGLDANAARLNVLELPWVESAEIRKIYPNTIQVTLNEREAYAVWQSDEGLALIDAQGDKIVPYRAGRHAQLPLIVGRGAEVEGKDFIAQVASYPQLADKVRAYVRVADRRWDLLLDNGVRVMLPETDVAAALVKVNQMDQIKQILSRDIASLDMRLDDRMTVRLTERGMQEREKVLKERQKAMSRAGKRA